MKDNIKKYIYETDGFEKFGPNARKARIIGEPILYGVITAIMFVIKLILGAFKLPGLVVNIYTGIFFIAILCFVISYVLSITVGFNRHRFKISKESIEQIEGIINVSHEIVPIRRMLQINVEQGPISRVFGVTDIEIITAGGSMTIDGVDSEKAIMIEEHLKDEINRFAEEEEEKKNDE